MIEKKLNKKILLLQSIAIILVVIGHKGGISIFNEWFNIYSYHMPLFVFISGYFYKNINEENIFNFIVKKIRNLVVPYYIWAFIYLLIINILKQFNLPTYSYSISLKTFFIEPWVTGHQLGLNVAAWFVLSLFLIQVFYILFRKFFKVNNEWIIMILFLIIGTIAVWFANKGYNKNYQLVLVRTSFLIQFYHMGCLYKEKIEGKFKINSLVYFILLFIFQFLITYRWGNNGFSAVFCNEFSKENILLPVFTSITGIMLWLKVTEILLPILGENKYLNYIGKNTWTVMMNHQLIFYFINLGFLFMANLGYIDDFNYNSFYNNMWFSYKFNDERFGVFYVIIAVAIPLILKKFYGKYINTKKIKSLIQSKV